MRLVQCGSGFLTDAETRFSTNELMLIVVWIMSRCRLYLSGLPSFNWMTDHRPLILIINAYTLDAKQPATGTPYDKQPPIKGLRVRVRRLPLGRGKITEVRQIL